MENSALFTDTISHLYALVFLIGLSGYLPQIIQLAKTRSRAESISLLTWTIWSSSWLISLLYGIFCLEDVKFSLVATINLIGHASVMGLVISNRRLAAPVTAAIPANKKLV